jgi:two-component system cell cycle sensor histidine kinase/response regulator CckA
VKFRSKLIASFGAIAAVLLGASALGYWEAARLGSALHEVGAVRLPSIVGLNLIQQGKSELDASARVLAAGPLPGRVMLAERERRALAEERVRRGWAQYEPLPQTPDESVAWKRLVPAWNAWKSKYDAAVAAAEDAAPDSRDATAARLFSELSPESEGVDTLLAELGDINIAVAASARVNSVASYKDLPVVGTAMLSAALLSILAAVVLAIVLSRRLSEPLVQAAARAASFPGASTAIGPGTDDEVAGIENAMNAMLERQKSAESHLSRAYEASRKAQDKFSRVFMSAPVCIVVSDLETGVIVEVNDEFLRVLGYSREEIIGQVSLNLGIWPDPAAREQLVERLRTTGHSYDTAQRLRAKGGTIVTVRAAAHTVELDGNKLLVAAFVDITEQQRIQDALAKSEEKFSRVFMSAPVGIVVSTLDEAKIAETNQYFLDLLGFEREEVIGRTAYEIGVWPDPQARDGLVSRIQSTDDNSIETQLRTKTGELRTVSGSGHILELDGDRYLVSAVVDVTEQRRAQIDLRRSEQLYRELVDGVRDMIVAMTPQGILTALNPAFENVTGMPRAQWIGQPFVGLVIPEEAEHALTLLHAALEGAPHPLTELRIRTGTGDVRIAETFLSAQRDNGAVVGVLGIARDVTDRVELEAEYRHAQKMEAVGRLAGGVAHDFNNLLTVISGYSRLLLDQFAPEDPMRADVEQIVEAGDAGATLTRQLLAFSRRQILQSRVIDLNNAVSSAMKLMGRLVGEDIHLVTSLDPAAGSVLADAGQLEQTMMNLVVNARDAMPGGGTLTITTGARILSSEFFRVEEDAGPGEYVLLAVSDTGSGMDEETKSRIFEPFFTTKDVGKGTGLGLATVFGIVRQSKGIIRVTSEVGKGSSFEIYLPKVDDMEEPLDAVLDASNGGNETVLLVEDKAAVRGIVRQMLELRGYDVLEASGGLAALDLAAQHSGPIHLLLTDVVMLGMGGRELAQKIVEFRPDIRTLFMSGHITDPELARDVREHRSALLQKPFHPTDLARAVREILDAPAESGIRDHD